MFLRDLKHEAGIKLEILSILSLNPTRKAGPNYNSEIDMVFSV